MKNFVVLINVVVWFVVAAAATVYSSHVSLLCQRTKFALVVLILNTVVVCGIRAGYAFQLR